MNTYYLISSNLINCKHTIKKAYRCSLPGLTELTNNRRRKTSTDQLNYPLDWIVSQLINKKNNNHNENFWLYFINRLISLNRSKCILNSY